MDSPASNVTPLRRPRAMVAAPAPEPPRRPLGAIPHGTRILRRPEVERRTGLSRSSIYRRIAAGTFPAPVDLGGPVGWLDTDIDSWIHARKRTRP